MGLIICFVGSFMYIIMAHSFFFTLGRMLHGAGLGLTSTLMVSMAAQVIPHNRMAEGLGYLGLGSTLSMAIGPLIGIEIVRSFGFEFMFIFIAKCYLAATIVSFFLPKIKLASDTAKQIKGYKACLEPKAIPSSLLILLYGAISCSVNLYLAIYCHQLKIDTSAATFFAISTIGTITARLTTGRLYDHYGHGMVIPVALAILMASMVSIILFHQYSALSTTAVFYGLAMGTLFPSIQALTLSAVPDHRKTVSSALFFTAYDIGIGLGTVLMGFAAGKYDTFRAVYIVALFFIAAFAIYYFCYFLIRDKRKHQKTKIISQPKPTKI
jgi:predicted MFS family arabinose efflux permease